MVIDGHAHACGAYQTPEKIVAYLDAHGIDKVLLCGGEPDSGINYRYPMMSDLFHGEDLSYRFNQFIRFAAEVKNLADHLDEQNRVVWQLSRALPQRVLNAFWVDPLERGCIRKLTEYHPLYDFKMVKLHQCFSNFDVGGERCTAIFRWAAQRGLPVFIHLFSRPQVESFVRMANRHPETDLVVAHMIGADYMYGRLTGRNVWFDLSAPQLYSADTLRHVYKRFGADRFLFGSDVPYGVGNPEQVRARLAVLPLTDEEDAQVLGGNLAGLLGLARSPGDNRISPA